MSEPGLQTGLDRAVTFAVGMLTAYQNTTGVAPDPAQMNEVAVTAARLMGVPSTEHAELVRRIESVQDIALDGLFVVPADGVADPSGVWQPAADTPLVTRFLRLLEQEGWPAESRVRLGRVTRGILGRCGNPTHQGPWSRRGMVVGDVQSGKTTSYVTLICAAIDAGYRNIVVLGGRTNDLRHQTQERVDLGVTGVESSRVAGTPPRIGVGLIGPVPGLTIVSLTSQDHVSGKNSMKGDFNRKRAGTDTITGETVCIAVVKKHASILRNLADWFTGTGKGESGPLLLIDDEADDASIDTNEPEETPTAINGAIRRLLGGVQRSSYVAYTATPYANVLIDPDAHSDGHGADLFPRDFIALLTPSPAYFGARRFLADTGAPDTTVGVLDADGWIVEGQVRSAPPPSLLAAIREFILVSAARRARRLRVERPRQHETMLIHGTVRAKTHIKMEAQVRGVIETLQAGWHYPVGSAAVETEFLQTWAQLEPRQLTDHVSWKDIRDHIGPVLDDVRVEAINGITKVGLDYRRAQNGPLTVIAIGGMKLSRGLTLEGLTTSYHLRETGQYDTLMQMSRWFGYRPGYEDLCRLHTTPDLLAAFTEVMESDEELRTDLEDMASLGADPLSYGLRIRTSPGMTVTARNKMHSAETVRAALAGKTLEVTRTAAADARHNEDLLQDFVRSLGDPLMSDERHVWHDVPWSLVEPVLSDFREARSTVGLAGKVRRSLLHVAAAQSASPPRLMTWTVALAGLKNGQRDPYGGLEVVRVGRTLRIDEPGILAFGAVSDPRDEGLARGAGTGSTRTLIKKSRTRDEGLLLIYPVVAKRDGTESDRTSAVAVSFPNDGELQQNLYVRNVVAQREEGVM